VAALVAFLDTLHPANQPAARDAAATPQRDAEHVTENK